MVGVIEEKMSSEVEKVQKLLVSGSSHHPPDSTGAKNKSSLEDAIKLFVDIFLAKTVTTHPYACCVDAKTGRILGVGKKWRKLYLCKEDPVGKKVKEVTQRSKYHTSVFKENGLSSSLKNPNKTLHHARHDEWVGEEVLCDRTDELLFFFKRPKVVCTPDKNGVVEWDMNSVNEAARCLFVGQHVIPPAPFREAHNRTQHIPGEGKTCSVLLSLLLAENRDGSNPLVHLAEPMVDTIMADHEAHWFFDPSLSGATCSWSQGFVNF
ncbi:unnamed protein product [Amoebophrya sp. A120]|nr:unnamed protein product [Amoebophrya sp. A120]|eukprot:GSA120T00020783001.1